jgi:hypothetical protein
MTTPVDCPICMDAIDMAKNCVTTECGHCFHASCLMSNVAHNGFGCPYCRTAMAEEPENEEEDDDEGSGWSDVDEDDEDVYDDDALRGLRFMTNNLEGIEHDILDIHDENEYHEVLANAQRQTDNNQENPPPSASYITEKLSQQGITMEHLVKCLLLNHDEYENQYDDNESIESDIFGKMRILISNYRPTDQPAAPVPSTDATPATPAPAPVSIPNAPVRQAPVSEPKIPVTPRALIADFNECLTE